MTRHSHLFAAMAMSAMLAGCTTTADKAEQEAAKMLNQARTLMACGDYSAARDTIMSLRQQHPTALEARRAAILTLDSVELAETRDSLELLERQLDAAREGFKQMQPRVNGRTNDAYYEQQRRVMALEQHFDEMCAKVKFFIRKIDIDQHQQ